jgi:hypothetical protein
MAHTFSLVRQRSCVTGCRQETKSGGRGRLAGAENEYVARFWDVPEQSTYKLCQLFSEWQSQIDGQMRWPVAVL